MVTPLLAIHPAIDWLFGQGTVFVMIQSPSTTCSRPSTRG